MPDAKQVHDTVCAEVVVAFSSLRTVFGECLSIHSLSVLFFFFEWRLVCAN